MRTIPVIFLSTLLAASLSVPSLAEDEAKKVPDETGKAFNTLNTDMQKFSEEFLDGKNHFGPLQEGNKQVADKFKAAGAKDKKEEPSQTPDDLKISEKETGEEVSSEIYVPDLDKKTAEIKVENGNVSLSYRKKPGPAFKNSSFALKTRTKFSKTFPAPKKAASGNFRTKIDGDKIIITFKKKKK